MKFATRLDAVVKIREKDEEQARRVLADAQRQAEAARQAAEEARERARHDGRAPGLASQWDLADSANARALQEASVADQKVQAAGDHLNKSQQKYAGAYRRAEVIRRVATARRSELMAQAAAVERKQFDELSVLLHVR